MSLVLVVPWRRNKWSVTNVEVPERVFTSVCWAYRINTSFSFPARNTTPALCPCVAHVYGIHRRRKYDSCCRKLYNFFCVVRVYGRCIWSGGLRKSSNGTPAVCVHTSPLRQTLKSEHARNNHKDNHGCRNGAEEQIPVLHWDAS